MIAGVIEEILPAGTVAVDTREDLLDCELFPEERAALGDAVEKRRREFISARACAQQALAQLGMPRPVDPRGDGGSRVAGGGRGQHHPLRGYRACAVARALRSRRSESMPSPTSRCRRASSTRSLVARSARRLETWCAPNRRCAGTGFCSAPRRPSTRPGSRWHGLAGVRGRRPHRGSGGALVWRPAAGIRSAARRPPPGTMTGRWLVREGLVLTAVALPAEQFPGPSWRVPPGSPSGRAGVSPPGSPPGRAGLFPPGSLRGVAETYLRGADGVAGESAYSPRQRGARLLGEGAHALAHVARGEGRLAQLDELLLQRCGQLPRAPPAARRSHACCRSAPAARCRRARSRARARATPATLRHDAVDQAPLSAVAASI